MSIVHFSEELNNVYIIPNNEEEERSVGSFYDPSAFFIELGFYIIKHRKGASNQLRRLASSALPYCIFTNCKEELGSFTRRCLFLLPIINF